MKKLLLQFSVILVIIAGYSCKKPSDGIIITFNTSSLFKSPLLVIFENANPNNAKQIGDFEITITGKDSALVQMGTGGRDFKVSQGMVPLALKAQAKPSAATPLTFVINATVAGYEPIHQTIILTTDSALVYVVPAFDLIKKVDGTGVLTNSAILNAGITTKVVTLSTPTSGLLSEKVTLTIPEGTEMRDSQNKLINANTLKSTLIAYGTSANSLKSLFPYGLNSVNARDKVNNEIPFGVSFTAAGAVHVQMLAGNITVQFFSKPVEVSQELPSGLINQETKAPVKAGDIIPIWLTAALSTPYQNNPSGATVSAGTNGKLVAKYTITTPKVWNLAWGSTPVNIPIIKELTINFNPTEPLWTGSYYILQTTESGIFLSGRGDYQPARDFFQVGKIVNNAITYSKVADKYGFQYPSVPNIQGMKILVYDNQSRLVGSSAAFNPTTASTVNISVNNTPIVVPPTGPVTPTPPVQPPPPIEYVTITATFTGKCSTKNIVAPLNSWVTLNDVTANKLIYVYIKNGIIDNPTASIQLIVGHQFKISSNYNGTTYSTGTFPVLKNTIVIPAAAENFSAITSYNAATNVLDIVGVLTQDCK